VRKIGCGALLKKPLFELLLLLKLVLGAWNDWKLPFPPNWSGVSVGRGAALLIVTCGWLYCTGFGECASATQPIRKLSTLATVIQMLSAKRKIFMAAGAPID
jgi:hypothetical protein